MDREHVRQWLTEALAQRGETPTALARKAGVSQSTLTRFLADADGTMLSMRTMAKLVHVIGRPPPGLETTARTANPHVPQPENFREPEAEPYSVADLPSDPVTRALAALTEGRNAADVWVLRTAALRNAGYLPGDLVIVDLNATPKRGDIVCAQVYEWAKKTAETIFRIYEPPYLVAAGDLPNLRKPLVVDENQIIIKGVVTQLLRR